MVSIVIYIYRSLDTLDGLALVLCCQGRFEEAEIFHKKCVDLSINSAKLGYDHEDTKTYIANLNECMKEKNNFFNKIQNVVSSLALYVVPALLALITYHFLKDKLRSRT